MLYLATAALAFSAPTLPSGSRVSSSVVMTAGEPMLARRAMFGAAAAAVATAGPMAAFADGASSPAVLAKSRAIYGSRIFREHARVIELLVHHPPDLRTTPNGGSDHVALLCSLFVLTISIPLA